MIRSTALYTLLLILVTTACRQGDQMVPYSETDEAHPFQFKPMHMLAQLEGTWVGLRADSMIQEEVWVRQNGNEMTGTGTLMKATDTVSIEHLSIIQTDTGTFYLAQVPDQNEGRTIPFRLTTYDQSTFDFTNPKHDFPQRILYSLSNDTLSVMVSTLDSTKQSNFQFIRQQ